MKFSTPKKQKGRGYGWRTLEISAKEECALKDLYPDFKKNGSKPKRPEADQYLFRVQSEVEQRVHDNNMGRWIADSRPWAQHVQEYIEHGELKGGLGETPWTKGQRNHVITYLRLWTSEISPNTLMDIRRDKVSAAMNKWLRSGLVPSTINGRYYALSGLMSRVQDLLGHPNPIAGMAFLEKEPKSPRGAFTEEEFRAILDDSTPQNKILYQTAYQTGYRKDECRQLRVKSINWVDGTIDLDGISELGNTKNKKNARQPVSARLLSELWSWCAGKLPEDALFRVPIKPNKALYNTMGRLGIPKVREGKRRSFHSIRHARATILYSMGIDIVEIQKGMRHDDPATTWNYIDANVKASKEIDMARELVVQADEKLFPEAYKHHNSDTSEDGMRSNTLRQNDLQRKRPESEGLEPRHSPVKQKPSKPNNISVLRLHKPKRQNVTFAEVRENASHLLHKAAGDRRYAELLAAVDQIGPEEAERLTGLISKKRGRITA